MRTIIASLTDEKKYAWARYMLRRNGLGIYEDEDAFNFLCGNFVKNILGNRPDYITLTLSNEPRKGFKRVYVSEDRYGHIAYVYDHDKDKYYDLYYPLEVELNTFALTKGKLWYKIQALSDDVYKAAE